MPAREGLAHCRIDSLADALPAPETPLFSALLARVFVEIGRKKRDISTLSPGEKEELMKGAIKDRPAGK